jgi:adenylate cyclase
MNTGLFHGLIEGLERAVVEPHDRRSTRNRKVFNVLSTFAFSVVFTGLIAPAHLLHGAELAGWIYVGMGVAFLLNIAVFATAHKDNQILAATAVTIGAAGTLSVCLVMGGLASSAGGFLWILVAMVALLTSNFSLRQEIVWSALCVVAIGLISLLEPRLQQTPLPDSAARFALVINFLAICVHVCAVVYYTVGQNRSAFRLLRDERAKSEGLLLNILPREIAAILKNEPRTIAEHFPQASILFADVVGFTPMTASMSPRELVELLNEVFSCFDELVEEFGLEKIKTIGDCYMVASGVPRPRDDHAEILVRMALAMQHAIRDKAFSGRRLVFRIGVNSGPVVAGVIGKRKFAYDLWGDAVNTASRMESHGQGGHIQITRSTYELIRDRFACEPKGVVQIKGKGPMEVWHVIGFTPCP